MDTELKTSHEWARMKGVCISYDEDLSRYSIIILDPDGWDRRNLHESFNELITEQEFDRRVSYSTCEFNQSLISEALQKDARALKND